MRCLKCNRELSDGARFCVYCGNTTLRECPGCKKNIHPEQEVCEFCGLDIPLYEKKKELLEEGKELQREGDYEGAKIIYEKIKGVEIVEVVKLLEEVNQKIEIINENRAKAEESLKSKKWSKARHYFIEIRNLLPGDEYATSGLKSIEARTKQRLKKVWIGVGIVIIIGAGIGLYLYINTVYYLAKSGIRSLLDSDNLEVRNSAALVLGWRGDKSGISTLHLLANSGIPRKSIYSLSALLELEDPNAVPMLKKVMQEGDVAEKIGAAYALTKFGDTLIVPELASYLSGADEDLRIASSVLLFNFGYSLGIPVIEEALKDTLSNLRFRALYALYLLGDKNMLAFHEKIWSPFVKDLLWDKTMEVRLLAAFLLNQFSTTLTPQDSIVIGQILWEEYMSRTRIVPKVEEISEIASFYIVKGIINHKGDEDILKFVRPAKEMREKCNNALSRIELNDETVMSELMKSFNSSDKYERLYGALSLLKCGKKESIPVLKELLRDKDEIFKLTTCKLVFEFI